MGVEDAVDDIEFSKADYGSSAATDVPIDSLPMDPPFSCSRSCSGPCRRSPGWAEFRRLDNAQDLVIAAAGLGAPQDADERRLRVAPVVPHGSAVASQLVELPGQVLWVS